MLIQYTRCEPRLTLRLSMNYNTQYHQQSLPNELVRSRINNKSKTTNTTTLNTHMELSELYTLVELLYTSTYLPQAQKFQIMLVWPSQPDDMIFRPKGYLLTCSWVQYDLTSCKRTFNGKRAAGPLGSFGTASKVGNSRLRVGLRALRIRNGLERRREIPRVSHLLLFPSVVGLHKSGRVGLCE